MECHNKTDMPVMMEISKVAEEAKDQKTIFFNEKLECKPGQFVFAWIPGVDEKPMAVSYHGKNEFGITSHVIGHWTKAFDKIKKGDKIGIRGPYGNSFSIKENAVVAGGGIGMSSVSTLIDKLKNPIIINGARDKAHLIYLERYRNNSMIAVTDNGSYGAKGFTTDVLESIMDGNIKKFAEGKFFLKNKPKIVYTCGPEIMMKKVLEICNRYGVECEASLERYMKCSFGICGSCMIDDKIVCIDGPIFNSSQLNKLSEFGKFARIKTGRKVTLKKYRTWKG